MSTLERRYRRLLRLFPRAHRAVHEDEMLGVLMAGSHDGQRRPDAREALGLVSGGLRTRMDRAVRSGTTGWAEGASAAGAVGAIVTMLWLVVQAYGWIVLRGYPVLGLALTPAWLAAIVTVVGVVLDRRWLATGAASLVALGPVVHGIGVHDWSDGVWLPSVDVVIAVLTAVLLAVGRSPRSGLVALGRPVLLGVVALGLTPAVTVGIGIGLAGPLSPYLRTAWLAGLVDALPGVVTIALAVGLLRTPVGRRVVAIYALPLVYVAPTAATALAGQSTAFGVGVGLLALAVTFALVVAGVRLERDARGRADRGIAR